MIRFSVFFLIIFLFSSCFTTLRSQNLTKKEFIRAVQEADNFYYYDEDYEKAASLYESLLKSYPDNVNFSAKLGICYLNIDGRNQDALRLLKTASANIVSNDREYVEYGEKAPLDTYLYLAIFTTPGKGWGILIFSEKNTLTIR
jgi:tetratricopeptide (TPR) repeat protein